MSSFPRMLFFISAINWSMFSIGKITLSPDMRIRTVMSDMAEVSAVRGLPSASSVLSFMVITVPSAVSAMSVTVWTERPTIFPFRSLFTYVSAVPFSDGTKGFPAMQTGTANRSVRDAIIGFSAFMAVSDLRSEVISSRVDRTKL